ATPPRQCGGPRGDVVNKVIDRTSARCRWRGRGDLLDPGDEGRCRAADAQPRQSFGANSDRSCSPQTEDAGPPDRAVELVRVWRNQRLAGVQEIAGCGARLRLWPTRSGAIKAANGVGASG